jgi:hypothetical protein
VIFQRDEWEVCLYSDFAEYQVWCKNFPSLRRARRFMKKTFKKSDVFYCAMISSEPHAFFQVYYWNGRRLILWDKPWVLSRRQAQGLEVDY